MEVWFFSDRGPVRGRARGARWPSTAIAVATVFCAALPANLHAQTQAPVASRGAVTPPAQRVPDLSANARLVVLDVVVRDKAGNPVEGLTEKDFQVFEDGRLQRIRSVEPPSAHTLPAASAAAGASQLFDPAHPASFGQAPVNILVLDQLNTHFADSSFARRCLHDYLASQPALLPEPTLLTSVYDDHFETPQTFTRDRDALLRTLAAAPPEYAWRLEVNGKTEHGPVERLDQSLRALEEIAQSYARIPGRKNLIWVGGGFPTIDPTTIDRDDAQEVKDTLQHVTDVLLDARITLYAVDPSSSTAGVTEITDSSQLEFAEAAGDALAGNFDPFNASADFDRLGPVTGGRVVRGRNDVAKLIASSVDLGERFYTIAYTPGSASDMAAQYRSIRVECLRPGLTATTRGGYFPGAIVEKTSEASAAYDLTTAAQTAKPLHAVSVTVERSTLPNGPPETYIVHAKAADLAWQPQDDGGATASVYIMAVSLDAKGRMLGHVLLGMKAIAKPGVDVRGPGEVADFVFTAAPLPRAATLRFVVRDSATGRMGSVDVRGAGR